MYTKPELLAPAGNIEKLKTAFLYGADAVYVGGHVFGLRKYAENFTLEQLKEGIDFAHRLHKKVYVVLNGFAHDVDLEGIEDYLAHLQDLQPDGLIISDMGVFQLSKRLTTIPLHVSTQASISNKYAVQLWKEAGAKRVILSRETSIEDCKRIKEHCPVELEIFVHGAQCASYSGKCVISNYSSGRDSNRGGCVQSCRHVYDIYEENQQDQIDYSNHIMNAKDLMALRHIPEMIYAGIDSLKVEGRMKSNMYAAISSFAYRKAIDHVYDCITNNRDIDFSYLYQLEQELHKVSNRSFETGGLLHRHDASTINYEFNGYEKGVDFSAVVKEIIPQKMIFVEVRFPFKVGDTLECFSPEGISTELPITSIRDTADNDITSTQPNSVVKLPWVDGIEPLYILRKAVS